MHGLIHVVERDEHQIITLEFHDRAANPGLHFIDNLKFDLGALGSLDSAFSSYCRKITHNHLISAGELGSVFSCKSSGEDASMIYYRPYDSWTTTQDWQYKLPAGESVTAIAVGGLADPSSSSAWDDEELGIAGTGTIVVATDRNFVRFFSGSGLQKYVWNIAEDVVSIVAGVDWALVVVRGAGAGVDKKQGLEYLMVDLDTFEVVQAGKIPLRKGATLKWIGFTDDYVRTVRFSLLLRIFS